MEELVAEIMFQYAVLCREVFQCINFKEYDEEEMKWISENMVIISDSVHNLPHYVLMEDKSWLKSEVKRGVEGLDVMFSENHSKHLMKFLRIRITFRELESFLSEEEK